MKTSLLAKVSIAAAAAMLTFSPALAGPKHHGHGHGYHHSYGDGHHHYKKHRHVRRGHGHHHHRWHRHWKPRFYGWNTHRSYRGW